MSAEIKPITETDLEDEIRVCVPPTDSPNYPKFEKGIQKKIEWLRQELKAYGHIGHLAYDGEGKTIGFIEFVPAEGSPIPVEDVTNTALITCIYLTKAQGQGIGSRLLQTTLRQLWKIGVGEVKTVVSRSPQWINSGIYRKHGFQLEKTFYKVGNPEPLDLLTLRLGGPQPKIRAVEQHIKPQLKDNLPVEVLYFHSAQCPYSSAVYINHVDALAKFSKDLVAFKTVDSWKQPELAKLYGGMFSDTFINGRCPFFAPPKQEQIEDEIQKEIDRVLELKGKH